MLVFLFLLFFSFWKSQLYFLFNIIAIARQVDSPPYQLLQITPVLYSFSTFSVVKKKKK